MNKSRFRGVFALTILTTLCLLAKPVVAANVAATYYYPTLVPVTANGYTATGNTVSFTLYCGLPTGAELMVVKNTGLDLINGRFDNLTNGQAVTLSYGGTNYNFVANYYGGSGNDLVLTWADTRAYAWGYNDSGELGDGTRVDRLSPVPVTSTGPLAGRTIVSIAAGDSHSLALCADGTLLAWGYNGSGELGDNTTLTRYTPVAVNAESGVSALYGKTVVAVAVGTYHSLALCSDGTIAAWGGNGYGELGDTTTSQHLVPVAVNTQSGISALYGKKAVAIAAASRHSLALCSDGTVAAWGGDNGYGVLGNGTTDEKHAPFAVNKASGSALFGKTVVAIDTSSSHSLALCSDGTVAAWGHNAYGELGDGGLSSSMPVAVNAASGTSALYGKTVVSVKAGNMHSLALCADGTATAWGYNDFGQLGDNTTTYRVMPVAVSTASGISALFGKAAASISADYNYSLAICSDGTGVGWGANSHGKLGDGTTTQRNVPVRMSAFDSIGQHLTRISAGSYHALALSAMPPAPVINIAGNSLSITNGDAWPSPSDGTDFGIAKVGGSPVARTYVLRNTGAAPLHFNGAPKVTLSGPHAADFMVTGEPAASLPIGGETAIELTFSPRALGKRTAALVITNDDPAQAVYVFSVQGTGATTLNASYATGTEVPFAADGFIATESTVNFNLNYAPLPGTELMIVKNTGLSFIQGNFDNLTNNQPVSLSYNGVLYNFVANYYGGDGNDLVLTWADNRVFAWGANLYGQLGDNSTTNRLVPAPVFGTGVLTGKTVVATATGYRHSLALCSDGTLAAWGRNNYGQLGNNNTNQSQVPVLVNTDSGLSALSGKRVVAIAAGGDHSLALCSDGTVAAWGYNYYGQLGDDTDTNRLVPVLVNTDSSISALAGKSVVAVAAGGDHSLALCSDGSIVAWGDDYYGQLGDNGESDSASLVPVCVSTNSGVSALYGKAVTAIAAGGYHSLALCSDGTVVAWGWNGFGELGDNAESGDESVAPVAVNADFGVSALNGRTAIAIKAGYWHNTALCSDGAVVSWGLNQYGQLGDNTIVQRSVPVFVSTNVGTSALSGKTVVGVAANAQHSLAICSDASIAAWGFNGHGELGDGSTTNRTAPGTVNTGTLALGQRFSMVSSGAVASHTLAVVALPPVQQIGLVGNGLSITNGDATPDVADGTDFGLATVGGSPVVRTFTIQNTGTAPLNLTGLPRVAVTGANPGDFGVSLSPNSPVASGGGTVTFQVSFAPTLIGTRRAMLVIPSDDSTRTPYVFAVQGVGTGALNANYSTGAEVPVTDGRFTATGNTVNFALNYAPTPGTELMVVKNTGLNFINGAFDNLTNGQPVVFSLGGTNYDFVANYYGGSGRDLVLMWADNRVFGWGTNYFGQLGNGSNISWLAPVPVFGTGVLNHKTIVATAAGYYHSLALCSDGTLAAWGRNDYGQLGNNSTTNSLVPVLVNTDSGVSALYGKKVVAIAAGGVHSLALCSDGTVAAWGDNYSGKLGDNSVTNRLAPVSVNTDSGISALAGKAVVAIAAGANHNLALCSDGTTVGWGNNNEGQLGDNTRTSRSIPVLVSTTPGMSALAGKTVVAIAAGNLHSLALCSDGTVAAWGDNDYDQLGSLGVIPPWFSLVPVAADTTAGVSALYGKTVVSISAGSMHSLALCSDGTLAAWGYNRCGQLGDNTTTSRSAPGLVSTAIGLSALSNRTVVAVSAGALDSWALCSDGTCAAWGAGGFTGDGTTTERHTPVAVNISALNSGERMTRLSTSPCSSHSLALVAAPRTPQLSVACNGFVIAAGDTTPAAEDGTDFGNAPIGGSPVIRTFTVQNNGTAPLLPPAGTPMVSIIGPNASDFVVTQQPSSPLAAGGGASTFQVTFVPTAISTRTAILSITNGGPNQNPYLFSIQGTGNGTANITYSTGTETPLVLSNFRGSGSRVYFTLAYMPIPGTDLTVVRNPSSSPIGDTFDNLTNGQAVTLNYNGTNYGFVANYYGGRGNDLVLSWASSRLFACGTNSYNQLGDGTTSSRPVPVPVTATGVLAGKTVLAVALGTRHSLALCSDGTLAAWGANSSGQLGDNTQVQRSVPVAVNMAPGVSALYGKRVVAIAVGDAHSLALCSDGTVAAWGTNSYGQLGDNTTSTRLAAVAVNTASGTSALFSKTVVAIAAGARHSLALCTDGTVSAWGDNFYYELGDGSRTSRAVPVAVSTTSGASALYGKSVVAIAAGSRHSLALCSDGTVAAWGDNVFYELGDNSSSVRSSPVAVNTVSGTSVLFSKTVVAIAAGGRHSLALCSDGTLAAWGYNPYGQLGDNTTTDRKVPVTVNSASGVSDLYGKIVAGISAGANHSMAICADGSAVTWGYNGSGQLGNGTNTSSGVPIMVTNSFSGNGRCFTHIVSGPTASHTLALVAAPQATEAGILDSRPTTNGGFWLSFNNTPGAFVSVLASTNVALPLGYWTTLGDATNVAPGQFEFTDLQATNFPQRFYRLRSP